MSEPLRYADFAVGAEIGQIDLQVTDKICAALPASFPDATGDDLGLELTVATLMRAYLSLVTPRPQGNIHAGLDLSLSGWVQPHDTIRATAKCIAKEQKRGTPFVVFEIAMSRGPQDIAKAEMRFLWAQ